MALYMKLPSYSEYNTQELRNFKMKILSIVLGLLKSLKYRYFGAKPTKLLGKVQILALNMTVFQELGPRADLFRTKKFNWLKVTKLFEKFVKKLQKSFKISSF
jgi:hypothetical protein